mmetsp:Transcript_73419/g.117016  ORF Transcript_73419/g.117016 Transcript_73419/m.117016 type:complete len:306 (+) Transcript_73419:1-918(+)
MDERRAQLRERGIHYVDSAKGDDWSPSAQRKRSTEEHSEDLSAAINDLEFDSYLDYLLKLVHDDSISNGVAEAELLVLFMVGYENNALLLEWVLLYMAKYPAIQQRVRAELFRVHQISIEQNEESKQEAAVRDFDLGLVIQCPLLRAFVHETLRTSRLIRCGLARVIKREGAEIEWKGNTYVLPKGGLLSYDIDYVSAKSAKENWKMDEDGKVKEFDLDNFVDENGRFKLNESLISFGFGARDCPGKAFAIKFIVMNAAYLIMNYQVAFGDKELRTNPTEVEFKCDLAKFNRIVAEEMPFKFSKI